MPTNISTIRIHASAQSVWNALTQPDLVKRWQYGSVLTTDWQVGSDIRFRTEWQGKVFEQWGQVLSFQPCEKLSYRLFAPRPDLADKPENYFVMNYVLTPEGDQTKLDILQEDNRPGAVQEAPQGEENPILQSLKNIVEGNA